MTIRREDGLGDSRDHAHTGSVVLEWRDISSAPSGCQVLAGRHDEAWGEWAYAIVQSPPIQPFTHWMPLPAPPSSTTPAPGERSREANSSHLEGLAEGLEAWAARVEGDGWAAAPASKLKQAAALLRSQAVEIEGLKDEKDAAYADRARDTVTASERIFKLVQDLRAAEASLSRLQADLKLKEEALEEIARGLVPPEQHGHYLAHRAAVRIARSALSRAVQGKGEGNTRIDGLPELPSGDPGPLPRPAPEGRG